MPGWIANYKEIMDDPEARIYRPRQIYRSPTERRHVPIEDQGYIGPRQVPGPNGSARFEEGIEIVHASPNGVGAAAQQFHFRCVKIQFDDALDPILA